MAEKEQSRTEVVRIVVAVALTALMIAFVIDNTRQVKVGFVFGDHETRLIYVLIVTALIGIALDRLWLWHRRH
jgi:uncharacterized integral membrane protein